MTRAQPPNTKAEFAERLKAVRIMAQYKYMRDFADELGYPEATYGRWERGEVEPPLDALLRIRLITNVSLDFLIAGERVGPMNIKVNPAFAPGPPSHPSKGSKRT